METLLLEKKIFAELLRARRVLLVTDLGKDADTSGSALALAHALRDFGIEAVVWSDERFPATLEGMPGMKEMVLDESVWSQHFDVAIVLDSSRVEYISEIRLKLGATRLIVIDHHASNTKQGDLNLVRTEASSTCEVVYQLLKTNRVALTPAISECLLAGILSDTMSFSNGATSASALHAAAELVRAGARIGKQTERLTKTQSPEALELFGRALERLVHNERRRVALTYMTHEESEVLKAHGSSVADIVAFLQSRLGVETILVAKEDGEGGIRVSCRTEGDLLAFVESFGGGGHRKACAFGLKGKIQEAEGGWYIRGEHEN